ncbi:hypothetical protein BLNAU_19616 [Blattamonas nauphoetae]|uniref:Reverse transcriptase domain-containing protein n=1 Tax=Blattamonas nauphoetae TaxID=2049346 RepID=A0ABQ9X265_9EUKA|nr:hypothetical protein BLNAU_19616 [Blattamonas nauphoetae]
MAPRTFSENMKVAVRWMREAFSATIIFNLDDLMVVEKTAEACRSMTALIASKLQELGVILAMEKCVLNPVQSLPFLGWLVNSAPQSISITESRQKKLLSSIKEILRVALRRELIKTRRLAWYLGELNFLRLSIPELKNRFRDYCMIASFSPVLMWSHNELFRLPTLPLCSSHRTLCPPSHSAGTPIDRF